MFNEFEISLDAGLVLSRTIGQLIESSWKPTYCILCQLFGRKVGIIPLLGFDGSVPVLGGSHVFLRTVSSGSLRGSREPAWFFLKFLIFKK